MAPASLVKPEVFSQSIVFHRSGIFNAQHAPSKNNKQTKNKKDQKKKSFTKPSLCLVQINTQTVSVLVDPTALRQKHTTANPEFPNLPHPLAIL